MSKLLTLTIALFSLLIIIGLLPVRGEEEVYDNVIRLHVIANSDSEEDQELKLKVRDAVLEASADFCAGFDTVENATREISGKLDYLREVACNCIVDNGFDYTVSVTLGEERYPRKSYDTFCFPSGEYRSLQVKIGEAEGQNWWCVLFPPMCLSAATEYQRLSAEDALINVGFTSEQYKIITESDSATYRVRFKILETIEGVLA